MHLQELLSLSGDGFIVLGRDGRVRIFAGAAEMLLEVAPSDARGLTLRELGMGELEPAARRATLHECPTPVALELRGRVLVCRVASTGTWEDGDVLIAIRDETELVAQQERSEAILAGASDGMVVFAPDGTISYVNPAASEFIGAPADSLVGMRSSLRELLRAEPIEQDAEARPCHEICECERLECPAYAAADLRCWLTCGTPGPQGEPTSYRDKRVTCAECDVYAANSPLLGEIGTDGMQEITTSEPEHRVLEVRTSPVIDRVGRYIGCMSMLRDVTAAREIAIMKNEFVSMVSHELRTPLTSIKGYVDLIVEGSAGEINETQREFLEIVQENSDRLVSLINDLLDISRIESGRVHLKVEPLDVEDIVRGVAETFKTFADRSGVQVSSRVDPDLPKAAGDRDRVGQVLMNFVSNAIKYSPGGGSVRIEARRDGEFAVVEVVDTGIGIAAEDQEKLFSKFFRVDSSLTREIGGTGLGLSICKSVVELLGGEVGVRSEEGVGSTFYFTIPLAREDLVRTPEFRGPIEAGGRVLVVDSNPEVARLVATMLIQRGYSVNTANSAREAFELAVDTLPDVIALDVLLEDMDGFDLLQRLKGEERTRSIPVLVLSIVCDEGKSLHLGAADYLEKPVDQDRLVSVVSSLVGQVASPVVLIVDDDRQIVNALSHVLRRKGHSIVSAYDGREAMAAIMQHRPDLVLLDLHMPVMDGYEVIREIKGSSETRDIPVVVMTAHRIDHDHMDLLALTAGQLSKPLDPEHLAERVEQMLAGGVR